MNEQELTRRISGLPRQIEPPSDLWPGIEARMNAAPPRSAGSGFAALAVAALLVLAIGLVGVLDRDAAIESPSIDALMAADDGLLPKPGATYATSVDLIYSGALRTLAGSLPQPQGLPSSEQLELTLRTLQHATEEIRAALAQDPDSIYLAELLESTHRKRVEMLRDAAFASLPNTDMGRRS